MMRRGSHSVGALGLNSYFFKQSHKHNSADLTDVSHFSGQEYASESKAEQPERYGSGLSKQRKETGYDEDHRDDSEKDFHFCSSRAPAYAHRSDSSNLGAELQQRRHALPRRRPESAAPFFLPADVGQSEVVRRRFLSRLWECWSAP